MGKAISVAKLLRSRISNDSILKLYSKGLTAKAVAKALGICDGTVGNRLRAMGIEIRKPIAPKQRAEAKEKIRQARLRWWKSPEGIARKERMCRQQPEKQFPIKH
jgi:hypothetical protein